MSNNNLVAPWFGKRLPKGLRHIAFITIILWLTAPKMTLFSISGFTQGIRLEDILFFFTYGLFIFHYSRLSFTNFTLGRINGIYLIAYILASSILSILIIESSSDTLIFSVRWMEYLLMGSVIVAFISSQPLNSVKLIKLFIIFNAFYASTWILVMPGLRYQGLSAGPWEISSVLIFLFIGIQPWLTQRKTLFYGILVFIVLLAAQSRIQMLAFIALIIFDKQLRLLFFNKITILTIPLIFLYLWADLVENMRFDAINSNTILDLFSIVQNMSFDSDFYQLVNENPHLDASMLARFVIWERFIEIWLNAGLYGYIFGIGPGRGGVVIDGFYVRLLIEFGLVGTIIFYLYLRKTMINLKKKYRIQLLVALHVIFLTNDILTSQRGFTAFCIAISLLMYSSLNYSAITKKAI